MSNAYEVQKRVPDVLVYVKYIRNSLSLIYGIIVLHHIWQEGIHCHHSLCVSYSVVFIVTP